jgi:hypothetical protein
MHRSWIASGPVILVAPMDHDDIVSPHKRHHHAEDQRLRRVSPAGPVLFARRFNFTNETDGDVLGTCREIVVPRPSMLMTNLCPPDRFWDAHAVLSGWYRGTPGSGTRGVRERRGLPASQHQH